MTAGLRNRVAPFVTMGLAVGGLLASAPALHAQGEGGAGLIVGQVMDAQSGRLIYGAQVVVVGGATAMAGLDGRYRVSGVAVGIHTIEVRMLGYATKTITGVEVPAGRPVEVNVSLDPAALQLQAITVTASQERGTVAQALDTQRNALGVVSSITAAEISRSPDSDAAAAVRRVSGVSVTDGRYVAVRGLGDRYTTMALNGARVPSPEPERRVVPLDLFPSSLLETITTSKTFTPDLPGDFSGAQVDIRTRDYPASREVSVSASTGFNPDVTGRPVLYAPGAGGEWLAAAAGNRRLPGEVAQFGSFLTSVPGQEDMNDMIGSFRNVWSARERTARPNGSFSVSVGGTDGLFGRDVGYVLSGTYSNSEEVKLDHRRARGQTTGTGGVTEIDRFEGSTGVSSVLWGGLANFSTLIGTHSRILLNTTYNRTSDDEARVEQGEIAEFLQEFQIHRLRYVERSVLSTQLAGEHQIGVDHRADWALTYSAVRRSEPDRSEFVYLVNPGEAPAWFGGSNDGAVRTFGNLTEGGLELTGDYSYSFGPVERRHTLKTGLLGSRRERDASNVAYSILSVALDQAERELSPEEIFDGRYSQDGDADLRINPVSQSGSYRAVDWLGAAYGMVDWGLSETLRLTAGARLEYSDVLVDATSTLGTRIRSTPEHLDVLPAASLLWRLSPDQNLRFSASQTLARPEYREIARIQYREVLGGDNVIGNPDLRRTLIRNVDVRWEWYPSPEEAFSVALFGKSFRDPVERVYRATSGQRTIGFANAEGAVNYGVELEARKELGSLGYAFEPLSAFANVTLMRSEIEVDPSTGASTSGTRPMTGQSPYVVNAGLAYASPTRGASATLLYNVVGRRINSAGELPQPDVYEEARHVLDLSLRFPLMAGVSGKADLKNLLDTPYEVVQGGVVREYYRSGRSLSLGVTWRP